MSTQSNDGSPSGSSKLSFAELKRRVRAVRSRHRRQTGAGGVPTAPCPNTTIDPLPSQNFQEKELSSPSPTPALTQIDPHISVNYEVSSSTPYSVWRAAGEFDVTIYCRPLNPRLLLVRTDDGRNGRVPVKPEMQVRFGTGKRIWVKPTAKDGFYELVGRYNQWGVRVHE